MTSTDRHLVHAFFNERLGLHWSDDFRGVLYIPDEFMGELTDVEHVAVAIGYNAFIGRSCCMHIVIQRPEYFTAKVIREAFEFPFIVCGCEAALALVDSLNAESLAFCARVGFEEKMRVPNGGPEGDLVVMQMLRSECRWLRKPH